MDEFFRIVKTLRKECPWDKEQTLKTIVEQIIEEVYELNASILDNNLDDIIEEIGDVLLGIFMMGVILEEKGIKFQEVVRKVQQKMIDRHPHVFGEDDAKSAKEVLLKWEKRKGNNWNIQKGLPALLRSSKIQNKASRKGFDWKDISGVYEKIGEELMELKNAKGEQEVREELGDILFACAHLGNFLDINPEVALQRANDKFERRFQLLEDSLKDRNIKEFTIEELEEMWQKIKIEEVEKE